MTDTVKAVATALCTISNDDCGLAGENAQEPEDWEREARVAIAAYETNLPPHMVDLRDSPQWLRAALRAYRGLLSDCGIGDEFDNRVPEHVRKAVGL